MRNGWIRSVAAVVVAAAVVGSACLAHAGDNKQEKKAAKKGEEYFDGDVSAVDFKAGTVTIKKKDAGTMTFTVEQDSKFYVKQKKTGATLTDFKVGDKVEVWYTVSNGTSTIHTLAEQGSHVQKKEKQADKGK